MVFGTSAAFLACLVLKRSPCRRLQAIACSSGFSTDSKQGSYFASRFYFSSRSNSAASKCRRAAASYRYH